MANATDSASILGLFNIGNGLIEVAALTSLIGSAAAQSLALGDKGPAGLIWATMTIFGAVSIVTLFTATATPGWLRDSIGVRNAKSDGVVGLSLDLSKSFKYRGRGEPAKAIECEIHIERRGRETKDPVQRERREVYAFDQLKANVLRSIPSCEPGEELKIHSYVKDPWQKELASHQFWLDSLLIVLSMIAKASEVFIQWTYGTRTLALISALSWLYFCSAALSLHLHSIRRHKTSVIDTLTGHLPTSSTAGGARKVLLGTKKGQRQNILWRTLWGFGAVVSLSTVVATYLALSRSTSPRAFFIWLGFQILWVTARSTIYYLFHDRELQYFVSVEGKPWTKVDSQERARVCQLVFALSKYQQHLHPRSIASYADDMERTENIPRMLTRYFIPPSNQTTLTVLVTGIIGDTLLASAAWTFGSKKGGFDFYDSCVVILDGTMAIPGARALSGKPGLFRTDSELGVQTSHLPRGGSIPQGQQIAHPDSIIWHYWLPCPGGYWLYFTTPQMSGKGTREASILSDRQVTDILARGELYISMKHVSEIREVVENSVSAYECFLELSR